MRKTVLTSGEPFRLIEQKSQELWKSRRKLKSIIQNKLWAMSCQMRLSKNELWNILNKLDRKHKRKCWLTRKRWSRILWRLTFKNSQGRSNRFFTMTIKGLWRRKSIRSIWRNSKILCMGKWAIRGQIKSKHSLNELSKRRKIWSKGFLGLDTRCLKISKKFQLIWMLYQNLTKLI